MECPKCLIKYRADNSKTPRILSNCGHSFCELCLNLLHDKESQNITCSICNVVTKIDDVKNLIKNMALLESSMSKKLEIFSDFKRRDNDEHIFPSNNNKNNATGNYFQKINNLNINNTGIIESCFYRSSTPNLTDSKAFSNARKTQQKTKSITQCLNFGNANVKSVSLSGNCSQHSKPLEAFCDTDKTLLCVSCILENDHKNHELCAIAKAAQVQKDLIEANLVKISEKERKIKDEINLIESHLKNAKYDSDEKVKNIENFFKKIYLLLTFREEFIKAKITNQFDSETEKVLFYRKNLEDKQKLVEQIKQEKVNIAKMSDLEVLALTKERNKLFENVLFSSFSSSDNFYVNNNNEESLNLNGINISNGNTNDNNNKLNSNENFISPKLEKIDFYNLCVNQENEINYLIKLIKSLLKRDLFDVNFLENFEINRQKITTNYVEINLDSENRNQHKDFNVNIFSDENLDKFSNNTQENINTNRNPNGLSGNQRLKSSSNSININNNNINLKELKSNYQTHQQNNLVSSNQNANVLNLANSGKFTSLTNFGNTKLNDKLDTKSEISNINKNNFENKQDLNIKLKNINYLKGSNNNLASTAALEKRSTCFINKEEMVNYENQVYKKLNEKENNIVNNNKQDKQQKEKELEKIKEKENKLIKKQPNSKKIYIMPNATKKTFKQSSLDKKKTTDFHSDNSFLNVKPENKIEKPILTNNEMLTDISPVHPHESSNYKMYDENITSFDSILDSSDNFHVTINNNPKNKFTQQIADTKLHNNINSYANKEKEKELFKKSKLDLQRNLNNNQANSNNNLNTINKGIDSAYFNSNNNAVITSQNLDDIGQKGFLPLSKMEGKVYSKKAFSNTQQFMNSSKKTQTKVNLISKNANLNNSSSVIEVNYNQNQIDDEEKEKTKRSKNNSQHSSRNTNNYFKTNPNSIGVDAYKNSKISSTLNIDLFNEFIPKENIRKRSSKSKECSLVRKKDSNKNPSESSSSNSKPYQKIRNIYPFGSNHSKNNSAGRKRLNNSNTEFNSNNNTSYNSNKKKNNVSVVNQVTINSMGNNYMNFKEEIKLSIPENKEENKNVVLQTFQNNNNLNSNSSNETIGKEGEIHTYIPLNTTSGDANKNVLVIRGSRTDQITVPNFKKEENKIPKNDENFDRITCQKIEDQQEFMIPKHRYNTSRDTGFLSITATEEYFDFINLNNTNIKYQNNSNSIKENKNKESNLDKDSMEIIMSGEKVNPDISAININNNADLNDITSKIIGLDSNTSRSIFRHDFASLYNPYSSHILSLGGKADIISRKYSIETNTWTAIREMKVERSDFVALMYKEKRILIMGGKSLNYNGIESVSDTIDLLSTDEQNIVRLDFKLKIPRSNFGAVYHDYKLFVAGGYNGRDALNNFEYFDKKSKKWIDLPKMFNKKKEFAMILGPENNIYGLGGSDERELVLKSFEVFDLKKNSWTKLEEMNQCRKGLSAISMPDGIYAIGGYDGCQYLKSVEKYDFESKRWKYIEDMNYPKCHFSCVSSSDFRYIYVLGGYDGKPMNIMERYDCLFSKWEVIDKLPTTKYRHQSVFLNE